MRLIPLFAVAAFALTSPLLLVGCLESSTMIDFNSPAETDTDNPTDSSGTADTDTMTETSGTADTDTSVDDVASLFGTDSEDNRGYGLQFEYRVNRFTTSAITSRPDGGAVVLWGSSGYAGNDLWFVDLLIDGDTAVEPESISPTAFLFSLNTDGTLAWRHTLTGIGVKGIQGLDDNATLIWGEARSGQEASFGDVKYTPAQPLGAYMAIYEATGQLRWVRYFDGGQIVEVAPSPSGDSIHTVCTFQSETMTTGDGIHEEVSIADLSPGDAGYSDDNHAILSISADGAIRWTRQLAAAELISGSLAFNAADTSIDIMFSTTATTIFGAGLEALPIPVTPTAAAIQFTLSSDGELIGNRQLVQSSTRDFAASKMGDLMVVKSNCKPSEVFTFGETTTTQATSPSDSIEWSAVTPISADHSGSWVLPVMRTESPWICSYEDAVISSAVPLNNGTVALHGSMDASYGHPAESDATFVFGENPDLSQTLELNAVNGHDYLAILAANGELAWVKSAIGNVKGLYPGPESGSFYELSVPPDFQDEYECHDREIEGGGLSLLRTWNGAGERSDEMSDVVGVIPGAQSGGIGIVSIFNSAAQAGILADAPFFVFADGGKNLMLTRRDPSGDSWARGVRTNGELLYLTGTIATDDATFVLAAYAGTEVGFEHPTDETVLKKDDSNYQLILTKYSPGGDVLWAQPILSLDGGQSAPADPMPDNLPFAAVTWCPDKFETLEDAWPYFEYRYEFLAAYRKVIEAARARLLSQPDTDCLTSCLSSGESLCITSDTGCTSNPSISIFADQSDSGDYRKIESASWTGGDLPGWPIEETLSVETSMNVFGYEHFKISWSNSCGPVTVEWEMGGGGDPDEYCDEPGIWSVTYQGKTL